MLALLLFAAVHAARTSTAKPNVSPVQKVVELLRNLKKEVQREGSREKGTYDTFACFCKSETIAKAASIESGETTKHTLEGDLKSLAATEEELTFDINQLTEDKGRYEAELKKATDIRNQENGAYQVLYADLSKAVSSLKAAISSIGGSKDTDLVETKEAVRQSLMLADALGKTPKGKVAQALLQGDVPATDYDFHSDDILGTLDGLLKDFKAQKAKAENEESAAQRAFSNAAATKRATITTTGSSITTKSGELSTAQSSTATKTGLLTEANAKLNDDNSYLKDLTAQCEAKAREWDQRSKLRNDELEALTTAFNLIAGDVKSNDMASGRGGRSLVQEEKEEPTDADDYTDVVFVQKRATKAVEVHKNGQLALRAKAVTMVKNDAEKLKSVELSLLAMRMAADPFAKVKTLIQQLIERLLKESADEASQKGWCDTSLAKANTDRDFRQGDLNDLSSSLNSMTAAKVSLEEEVSTLRNEVRELETAHSEATRIRSSEKAENKATLDSAADGLAALQQAIGVLQDFYKGAAKGSVSLVQTGASPVDQDLADAGAGHLGAYQGHQEQAGGIMGMLETIVSDFERTIKNTSEAEAEASADYTKFDRETKASVAAKTTGIARASSDIVETTGDLKAAYFSLQQNQNLLDAAMKSLETLRPQCVDTAMSPEERVARREAEVAALKKAVCVLDEEDNVIDECAGWAGKLFLQK